MIENPDEYRIVQAQLQDVERRLAEAESRAPYPNQRYSLAGLQRMARRLRQELSAYQQARPARHASAGLEVPAAQP